MITIHHLGVSQSDRVVWLMEELEERLGESDYLGADRFTCADIMAMFNLTSLEMLGARPIDDALPNTRAYVERVSARPAYQKAMAIAGPTATPPEVDGAAGA